jgi:hypothetical protein
MTSALHTLANLEPTEHALRLPVPEKAQKQYNFVLIPEAGLGIGDKLPTSSTDPREPLVWTVNGASLKHTTFKSDKVEEAATGHNGGCVEHTLNKFLGTTMGCKIVEPDHTEFESVMPEAHRKGEKAYHVKAFKGSKDGKQWFQSSLPMLIIKRLLILSCHWHLLRLQETTGILPV